MASTSDFRNGYTFKEKGILFSIIEFQHVKPGKGGAFVRTKLRNIKTKAVIDRTFRAGEKVEQVRLERKQYDYLYKDGNFLVYMDNETYDQIQVEQEILGDSIKFLKENDTCGILFHGDKPIEVEIPTFVELKITATEPGFKGNTASNTQKPAQLETGATVSVPLFIEEGTVIKVDTRTGEYIERVNK